ncbi:hypothetical protein [Kurthia gibsonii]|uniref:hypothetical protein n=1 Tax=Kurthia gibsonii TaxID=33946 RepID=UPI0031B67062
MGFWYFLILLMGIVLLITAFRKQWMPSKKWLASLTGVCMIAFSIFMFQDGSAEIMQQLLNQMNISF